MEFKLSGEKSEHWVSRLFIWTNYKCKCCFNKNVSSELTLTVTEKFLQKNLNKCSKNNFLNIFHFLIKWIWKVSKHAVLHVPERDLCIVTFIINHDQRMDLDRPYLHLMCLPLVSISIEGEVTCLLCQYLSWNKCLVFTLLFETLQSVAKHF